KIAIIAKIAGIKNQKAHRVGVENLRKKRRNQTSVSALPVCLGAVLAASIFSKLNSRQFVRIRVPSRLAFSPCSSVPPCLRGRFWLRLCYAASFAVNECDLRRRLQYLCGHLRGDRPVAAAGAQRRLGHHHQRARLYSFI